MSKLLVVSPHLDDAVLSVGQVIAAHPEVTVLTVFGGGPSSTMLTAYDQACGFDTSDQAMQARRDEERRASLVLGYTSVVGPYYDGQYGFENNRLEMRRWIAGIAEEHDKVLVPIGIQHADHLIAAAEAREAGRGMDLWMYEELPYRVQFPENVAATIAVMRNDRWKLELGSPFVEGSLAKKMAAVECYESQVSDAMRRWVQVPERVWRLTHK